MFPYRKKVNLTVDFCEQPTKLIFRFTNTIDKSIPSQKYLLYKRLCEALKKAFGILKFSCIKRAKG